jgi:endonuclease/exonuclease/phosphatase family metal-dependent hydrolase
MTTCRVLCYNVRSMRDDVLALGRVMRELEPHVALVQEAPRFARWRSKCAALARRSGLVVVGGGRPAGANLVLSSLGVDVLATRDVAFTTDRKLHHRGAALARLALNGVPFAVAGSHLDLVEAPRLRHLDELDRALTSFVPVEVPLLVAADANAVPGSQTWRRLERFGPDAFAAVGRGDGFTYSSGSPVRRIDGVFCDPRLRVLSATVIDNADVRLASDHRPLLVEIELG